MPRPDRGCRGYFLSFTGLNGEPTVLHVDPRIKSEDDKCVVLEDGKCVVVGDGKYVVVGDDRCVVLEDGKTR